MKVWAAVAAALLAAGWFGYRVAYKSGYDAGAAIISSRWAEARATDAEAHTEALRRSGEEFRREMERRMGIERELQTKLDDADRRGRDLARRLRAQSCPLPTPSTPASGVDGPAGIPDDEAGIGAALADHLAACERDAERFGNLQRWLNGEAKKISGNPNR